MRANAPHLREFGANLEHVIKLLQDASTPVIVLVEQAAGRRARNLGAAEQSQEVVDWFVPRRLTCNRCRAAGLPLISLMFCWICSQSAIHDQPDR